MWKQSYFPIDQDSDTPVGSYYKTITSDLSKTREFTQLTCKISSKKKKKFHPKWTSKYKPVKNGKHYQHGGALVIAM